MFPGVEPAKILTVWRLYLLLALIQGLVSLALILGSPAESETPVLLGLSPTRLLVGVIILGFLAVLSGLLLESWARPERFRRRVERLASSLNRQKVWWLALLLVGLGFILGCYFITLVPEIDEPFVRGIYERIMPLALWFTGMAAQTLALLLFIRHGSNLLQTRPRGKPFYVALFVMAATFLAWAWVVRSVYPLESRVTGWNSLGAPILDIQVLLAWGAGVAMLALFWTMQSGATKPSWLHKIKPATLDLIVCLLLWFVSVALWQSIPIQSNWFVSQKRPPNNEFYPNSDALQYDLTSQTALVGEGFLFFGMPFVRRPVLAVHHTLLHLIAGQDYQAVAFLQVLALGLLPVMVYLLTRSLHTRVSGVIAAVLVMLREANSIAISGNITTSHAKLLMADLPTALAVVAFVYATVKWLQDIERPNLAGLVAGGLLGIAILLRTETIIFMIALAVISGAILLRRNRLLWIKHLLVLCLGVLLVISPWVYRNWRITGLIFLDSPIFRFDLIFQRFRPVSTPTPTALPPVESNAHPGSVPLLVIAQTPSAPATPSPQVTPTPDAGQPEEFVKSVAQQALDFLIANPAQVAGFIFAHYTNSQLQTMLIFPTVFRPVDSLTAFIAHRSLIDLWYDCCSSQDYVRRMPYWHKWDGVLPSQAIVPIVVNLLLVAAGINETWKRQRWIGLTPLFLLMIYIGSNAVFRNSGGRYIVPVDWVAVLYYSVGLAYLTIVLISKITGREVSQEFQPLPEPPLAQPRRLLLSPGFYGVALALFLFGCSLPLMEARFASPYTREKKNLLMHNLMQSGQITIEQRQDIQTFLSSGGAVFPGRALYPRYYPAGQGEPGTGNPMGPRPYARLGFYLVGPTHASFLIPTEERPARFANAADVLVFACADKEALAVAVFDASGAPQSLVVRSLLPAELSCPLPAADTLNGDMTQ
jgi:hypothetical protein